MFCRGIVALLFGVGERCAHLRETGHHVAALLLQKAHVRLHTAEHILHAPALLAQVAHKQALLLEQRLELFELALLLVGTILGQLHCRLCLVATGGKASVIGL